MPWRTTSASAMARAESTNIGLSLRIVSSGLKRIRAIVEGRQPDDAFPSRRAALSRTSRARSPLVSKHHHRPPEISEQIGYDDRHAFTGSRCAHQQDVAIAPSPGSTCRSWCGRG